MEKRKKEINEKERKREREKTDDEKINQFDNAFVCNTSRAEKMNP